MSICKKCDRDYYEYNDVGDGLCPTCADSDEHPKQIDGSRGVICRSCGRTSAVYLDQCTDCRQLSTREDDRQFLKGATMKAATEQLHTLDRNFQRSRSLPVWRVNVLNADGRCIHAEEHVNLDDAQRAALEWCQKRNIALTASSEWLIG
jgi:hypothetical protein